jgi:hypothetical protein
MYNNHLLSWKVRENNERDAVRAESRTQKAEDRRQMTEDGSLP